MSMPARRPRSGPGGSGGPDDHDPPEMPLGEEPRAPTADEWAALTAAQRQQVTDDLLSYEQERATTLDAAPEGELHLNAKVELRDTLRRFFRTERPALFVSADIPVYYDGQKAIRPDVIAVTDVATHVRESWMVSQEGKGIDLALEIHVKGSWRKDFVDNVTRYAELGIHEYFIFDLRKGGLLGYRLAAGRRAYDPLPHSDRLHSEVLGLDLVVDEAGELRFFKGTAELLGGERLLAKVRSLYEAARQRAEADADAERERADTACAALAASIVTMLHVRGISIPPEDQERIAACRDIAQLTDWAARAATVSSAAALLAR